MRREHRRPFDMEADEAADLTQQFWGTTRGWTPEGDPDPDTGDHTPRSLQQSLRSSLTGVRRRPSQARRSDATGRVDRTRSHGIPRPTLAEQPELTRREATLGELAAGWSDDDWPELDLMPASAPTRLNPVTPARRREARVHDTFDDADEFDATDPELEEELIPLSPVSPLASRIGLGAVDPLLARLGAIVLAGVLVVPLALSARGGSHDAFASGAATVSAAPDPAAAPASTLATAAVAASGAPATSASVETANTAGAAAADDGTFELSGTIPVDAGDDTPSSAQPQAELASAATAPTADVTQSVSATTDPVEVATVDESAERVAPDCSLAYEAGAGDSWYRIADAAGVTPGALMDQNLAGLDTPIFPGDEICLPAGATMPSKPVVTTAPPTTTAPTAPPTTAKPPATTAPPPPPPASSAEVQALIREIWPDELEERALQIAWRESNYRATAYNGWCCYGVFQIHWGAHKGWLDDYGIVSTNDLLDARKNITAAYAIYQRAGGWGPWGG